MSNNSALININEHQAQAANESNNVLNQKLVRNSCSEAQLAHKPQAPSPRQGPNRRHMLKRRRWRRGCPLSVPRRSPTSPACAQLPQVACSAMLRSAPEGFPADGSAPRQRAAPALLCADGVATMACAAPEERSCADGQRGYHEPLVDYLLYATHMQFAGH